LHTSQRMKQYLAVRADRDACGRTDDDEVAGAADDSIVDITLQVIDET